MRFELDTFEPGLTDEELLYRIEHHLLGEMTSNITVGFVDEGVACPSLEEQKAFFERQDVRSGMREIILEIFRVTREEPDEGYEDDFYRELIYDGPLGSIYQQLQASRAQGNFDDVEIEELSYEDYTPIFPRASSVQAVTPERVAPDIGNSVHQCEGDMLIDN